MPRKVKNDVLVSYDFLPIFEALTLQGKTLASSELIIAIIRYDMSDTEPTFSDESVDFVWNTVIKPKLDANKKAYEEVAKARREAVCNRYNKNDTSGTNVYKCTNELQNDEEYTFVTDNDNDNDNVYVNDNVNDNDKEKKTIKRENSQKHKYGTYNNVLLSDVEMQKLQNEFPTDWQERIEKVSEYCASKGKSYKNYLATIRNWARRDKESRGSIRKNDVRSGFERALEMMGEDDDG